MTFPVTLATTAAITYNVSASGSDVTGDGSVTLPFATIQYILDQLPKILRHQVTIKVGVGNFPGVAIHGFVSDPANNTLPTGLLIQGTLVNATVATGTATGTFTNKVAGATTSATFVVLTDSGQSWTTNDLKGKLLEVLTGTNAGVIYPIASNTATTVTLTKDSTGGIGGIYAIRDWGVLVGDSHDGNTAGGYVNATAVDFNNCGVMFQQGGGHLQVSSCSGDALGNIIRNLGGGMANFTAAGMAATCSTCSTTSIILGGNWNGSFVDIGGAGYCVSSLTDRGTVCED